MLALGASLLQTDQDCDLIRFAIESGISAIDTAENYGRSEEVVGKSVRDIREQVVISTKFSPEHSRYSDVLNAAHRSLKNLRTDIIDIYYVHWPNYTVDFYETYKALSFLKDCGKISKIGLCNVVSYDLDLFLKLGPIDCIQMEYNLFDKWAGKVLFTDKIPEKFCYSPLDQGVLCDSPRDQVIINNIAQKYNTNVPATILAWQISKGLVPIFSSRNFGHIKDNASAVNIVLSQEDITQFDALGFVETQVDLSRIIPSDGGHRNRVTYKTIDDAIKNGPPVEIGIPPNVGYCPSTLEIAKRLAECPEMKPIKLSVNDDGTYRLIEGRVRYWGWRIAFGDNCKIPALIRSSRLAV